jgi:hypothetical protein
LQTSGVREVVIVDDVIFTGALLERIIDLLSRINVCVPLVCAGVGIAEGINRIGTKREIRCVRIYKEVVDEVCERDFWPGVPFSGRLLAGGRNVGVPYILPFGRPFEWASIPLRRERSFSLFCLRQTAELFGEVERVSDRVVFCRDLGREVIGLPQEERFVDALRQISRLV